MRTKIGALILAIAAAAVSPGIAAAPARHPTGLVVPDGWHKTALFEHPDREKKLGAVVLPSFWDWRQKATLPPIKNQGQCGSCWAFATTGVIESIEAILHPTAAYTNLAEQTLVSTCYAGGNCSGGFFSAFDYIRDNGLPLETADPYQARDTYCKAGLKAVEHISRWSYVGTGGVPTVNQIKAAVFVHGPVAVGIDGSGDFQNYAGGVFTSCGGTDLNHMVIIEGWQDDPTYASQGGGYWIVRNSWGSSWGENGRIRIVYGASGTQCNGIGQTAAYAVVDGVEDLQQGPQPAPVPPPCAGFQD